MHLSAEQETHKADFRLLLFWILKYGETVDVFESRLL